MCMFTDTNVWGCMPVHLKQIVDEAHGVRSTERSRYQRMMEIPTQRKLLLTGTPVQNNLAELFALLRFAAPDLFHENDRA